MLNVVCVLKKPDGGRLAYDAAWVQKLQRGVARNLTQPHRFICLSDLDIPGVEVVPLRHGWMLYWSKVEMFRPGMLDGPALYIDIDTMICGNIDALIAPFDGMVMLTDYYQSFRNSGLMAWDANNPVFGELYRRMEANPINTMIKHRYKGAANYGDQEFIADTLAELGVPLAEWQKIMPRDWFLEFSFEGRANPAITKPSPDLKICYCLGVPKFDNFPDLPLVRQNWR